MELHLFFSSIKYTLSIIGGFLLMIGATIEPSIGIWVVSLGGSLITVSLGEDRGFKIIFVNVVIGLFWGIFGSQLIHTVWPVLPQIALSFFLSMFGVNASEYIRRNLRTLTFMEIFNAFLDKVIPWKGLPKK